MFVSTSVSSPSPSPPPLIRATVKKIQWINAFEMLITPHKALVELKNEFNHIFHLANDPLQKVCNIYYGKPKSR